jgi:hypothetical protein
VFGQLKRGSPLKSSSGLRGHRGRSISVAMLLILVVLVSEGSDLCAGASFFGQQAANVTITTTIYTTTTSWTTPTIWSTVTNTVPGVLTTVQYTTSTSTRTVTTTVPAYAASVVSNDIPTPLLLGQSYAVHVVMQNTGANSWTAAQGYKLGFVGDNPPFGPGRIHLDPSASIAPGQQYRFTFTLTPTASGAFTLRYEMLREGVTWFGQSSSVSVTVPAAYGATIYSSDIPTVMTAGQTYTVHIVVQNTGSYTWTAAQGYKLGFVGDNPPFGPGRIHLDPSASIAPGQQYRFTFTLTPTASGAFTLRYEMLQEGVTWFGDTLTVTVTVA